MEKTLKNRAFLKTSKSTSAKNRVCFYPLPDFIAVWVPFILGTFKKPDEHPIIAPPGKAGYGIDWNLTSVTFVNNV